MEDVGMVEIILKLLKYKIVYSGSVSQQPPLAAEDSTNSGNRNENNYDNYN